MFQNNESNAAFVITFWGTCFYIFYSYENVILAFFVFSFWGALIGFAYFIGLFDVVGSIVESANKAIKKRSDFHSSPAGKQKYLYVIRENTADPNYKIGISKNPESRVRDFSTGNPADLEVLYKLGPYPKEKARKKEKKLHQRFSHKRKRGGEEWFDLSERDLEMIRQDKVTPWWWPF